MKAGRAGSLGIVVVNYGSHDLIESNLGGTALDGQDIRVIVVDNFSTRAERDAICAVTSARGWELVSLDKNGGFAAAVNEGVRHAKRIGCASVLLVNPDAVVAPDVIAELHAHCVRDPDAMVTPRIVASDGTLFFAGSELLLRDGSIRSGAAASRDSRIQRAQSWLTAACLVMNIELFSRIGGFDEAYFLYWEDVDLSYRAALAGVSLVVRDDLVVVHDEGGTQGERRGRAKSDTYYYYNCRNRLLFAARHLGRRDVLRWMLLTPPASWRILMRGGKRQILQSHRPLLATIRGSVAGLWIGLRALMRGSASLDRPGPTL
jgi:N-acetylglucosaminyl-diphospho-decaprenol L-rhamnosyltransferase